MANRTATLYLATKLPTGKWTFKPLPRKPVDLEEPSYYRLFWYEGKQRKSTDVGRFKDAAFVAKLNKERALRSAALGLAAEPEVEGESSSPTPVAPTALGASVTDYLSDVRKRRSHKTWLAYTYTLNAFVRIAGVDRQLSTLTSKDIKGYETWERDRGTDERTIKNRRTHLRTFYNAEKLEWPKGELQLILTYKKKVRPYKPEELNRLFAVCDEDEYDTFKFFLVTGGREGEVAHAAWPDIDFDTKEFLIQRKDGWQSKDKEDGDIPIPDDYLKRLKKRRERNPKTRLIFPNANGNPDGHFLRMLKAIAFRNGLNCGHCQDRKGRSCADHPCCEKWILHRFRKTFATMHHRNGVNPRTIQAWLRHSDLETTLRYLAADENETHRATVNKTFAAIA